MPAISKEELRICAATGCNCHSTVTCAPKLSGSPSHSYG